MKLRNIVATLLLAGVTTIAVAADTEGALVVVSGQVQVVGARTISATVTAIDPATRAITLTSAKGKVTEVVAGPEVRNFAQIKVGDEVVAKAVDSLSLELKKGGGTR